MFATKHISVTAMSKQLCFTINTACTIYNYDMMILKVKYVLF